MFGARGGRATDAGGSVDWFGCCAECGQPRSPARANAKEGTHVFTVIEHEVRTADVDTGDPGESPGDFFLFESRLLHPHTGDLVGVDSGKCMIAIRTFVCDATARIHGKGKIVVAGAFFSENDGVLPITGGTGAYRRRPDSSSSGPSERGHPADVRPRRLTDAKSEAHAPVWGLRAGTRRRRQLSVKARRPSRSLVAGSLVFVVVVAFIGRFGALGTGGVLSPGAARRLLGVVRVLAVGRELRVVVVAFVVVARAHGST